MTTKPQKIEGWKKISKCPACDGDGEVRYSVDGVIGTHTCGRCGGSGIITIITPMKQKIEGGWEE